MQLENKKPLPVTRNTDAPDDFEDLLNFDDDLDSMDDFLVHANSEIELDDIPQNTRPYKHTNPQARKSIEEIIEAKRLKQRVSDVFEEIV